MNLFYTTTERIAALEDAARRWQGTPWRANSCAIGMGASCHLAVAAVLVESGFALDLKALPRAASSWARHQTRSLMAEWLDARQELFSPIRIDPCVVAHELNPGDLVGFKCGLCIHHLGIILPGERFFQCIEATGAVIRSMSEPQFLRHLSRAWRPLEKFDPMKPTTLIL